MVDVDLVDMDDGSGFKEPAANRRSLVDERRMLFEKIVTSESQQQQPSVNRALVASKNGFGGTVRRSNYVENDDKRSDDSDSSPESTNKSDSDVSSDQNEVPSATSSPNRVPPPSPPLTKLAPSPIESDPASIDCDQNVSPKRISYYRAVSDRGADKPTPSSRSSVTTCFVANDRIDEDRGNDRGNIVVAAQSSRAFANDLVNEPEVLKRVSYHRALFETGGTTRARPKSSPVIENSDSVASVTELQRRRSHEDLIQCKSEQLSNFSSRTTRSDNHAQGGVTSSPPPKLPPSSSSSAHYPEELNPFSDDDETEDDHCSRPSTEGTSAKPTHSADSTNPFGSDSDDEDKNKAESSSKNPFGSDDENEPTETPAKSKASAVVSPKVPVPLPRTVEKLATNASPRPNPRPRNKHNDSSNDVSPTASCRSMPSSTVRRVSGDSLELSLKKSPSSVNSTLRKKKPAPLPPPLAQNKSKETNSTCDERKGDSSTKYTSNAASIENQKTMTVMRKTKKGPAPARPIPIRRPVKEMPLEDIKTELSDIEIKQQELERQGLQLEESIREKTESESAESAIVEEMVVQLFELVNEKNELFRRRSELTNMRKMHQLEEEHAEIEYQIRCLMLRPESNKTDSDKTKEEELIKRLLEIVEKRNEIIETMENERLRRTAEDLSVTTQLANDVNQDIVKHSTGKKNTAKKSKKEKQRKESGCGDSDNKSPSKIIKQKFMTLRQNAKKSQQTKTAN